MLQKSLRMLMVSGSMLPNGAGLKHFPRKKVCRFGGNPVGVVPLGSMLAMKSVDSFPCIAFVTWKKRSRNWMLLNVREMLVAP